MIKNGIEISGFSYNSRTGNIIANDKYIVRFERYNGSIYYYIKYGGYKRYLTQQELAALRKTVTWFTENFGCDFGGIYEDLINRCAYLDKGA